MNTSPVSENRDIDLTSIQVNKDKSAYIAGEELIQAVEVAIALNKPLVVSGEPGTGKTQLAHWVASQLHTQSEKHEVPFIKNALSFNTKSSSSASDLFYYYDAVSHFRSQGDKTTAKYVELKAMGLAIVLAHGKKSKDVRELLQLNQFSEDPEVVKSFENRIYIPEKSQSSVVLIDEIDKAPRDFPNDLLNEVENTEFTIKEMGITIPPPNNNARLVVIMTSNSEKNLPNAFLRRCVFYNIPFPDEEKLMKITRARMVTNKDENYDKAITKAIDMFVEYRKTAVNKKPATSEFLDWINVLHKFGLLSDRLGKYEDAQEKQKFRSSLNTLFKSKDDMERIAKAL
jgi:MoxR-like ATPase